MKHEDYARMGSPEEIEQNYKLAGHDSKIRMVAQISEEGGPVPTHMGILFEVSVLTGMCVCALDKKKCDDIIRALIAGRNNVWGKS